MSDWATLAGTLGGVGLGGVLGALTEHTRWRRERQSRWDDDRS